MDIFSAILFLIFIVFPAVAIYSFISRTVSGIYHWANKQHPHSENKNLEPQESDSRQRDRQVVESYLGYGLGYEDSKEYQDLLDSQQFDVRAFLNDNNRK